MTPSEANAVRYTGKPGHAESWFIRANDPDSPRAVWLKITLLAPLEGEAVAEAWFIFFDGLKTFAHKDTVPLGTARFDPPQAGGCRFELSGPGSARGTVGPYAFSLTWPQAAAEPVSLFPYGFMLTLPFPKQKLLTPCPSLVLDGEIVLPHETVRVSGWRGAQGHNWGREHTFEYAWGQCQFDDGTFAEGFSGRVKLGGRLLPRMSALVVRRGEQELRFDRTFDFLRQEASVGARRWTVRLHGKDGEARLRMDALDKPMACLGYMNPTGQLSYCFNTKLAEALLEVEPAHGQPFRCKSAFSGGLELLRHEPDPGVEVV
jgi:hypothetical protein